MMTQKLAEKKTRRKAPVDVRHPTSLRLDPKTVKRIAYLASIYDDNKTEAIRVAVRRLYRLHKGLSVKE